jgi:hypothetical protein
VTEQISDEYKTRTWWWWNGPHSAADNERFLRWRDAWERGDQRPCPTFAGDTRGERSETAAAMERVTEAARRARERDERRDDDVGRGRGRGSADAA